ncbi:hypothetical protein [Parasphingorhabdus halotolerans]|uniref:Uncharacterized protein n=1 Tax=Parasphingorhabdus halotolerans TaxID=2725558 RepID=A0A6H2DQ41_9SPHN|nr:hypothetical protein [Parasphingorhabdus halotolerans]QJB69786.1 hypothetical protein HF685_11265 [Parasphingorhabdus halotolerans]
MMFTKTTGLALIAMIALAGSAAAEDVTPALSSFEQMSALAGDWKREGEDGKKFHIEFELTANNSVLVERWISRGKTHSLTLYHRDKADVVATHYCPQGNQPRMKMSTPDGAAKITFDFWDATNLVKPTDNHQHSLSFDLSEPDRVKRAEVYLSGAGEQPSEMVLVRVR